MSDPTAPLYDYPGLSAALTRFGVSDDASALHGALSGALCRLTPREIDPVQLLDESDAPVDKQLSELLGYLLHEIADLLSDTAMSFVPLLPDDEAELSVRARALGLWCEGFLYGLAGHAQLDLDRCSEEVRELVGDFTEFTRAVYAEQDDLEVEEGAYVELVEYIRVGAQLIYMELHPRPASAADENAAPTIH